MTAMATPPESTKISLRQRLRAHAQQRWPQVTGLEFRYRGAFAYVDAHLPDGDVLPLLRLRYGGSAQHWGFGLFLASNDRYENQLLPSGLPSGTPEEALDCACDLYLNDPTAWIQPRRTNRRDH
jgi:hypothetical protein